MLLIEPRRKNNHQYSLSALTRSGALWSILLLCLLLLPPSVSSDSSAGASGGVTSQADGSADHFSRKASYRDYTSEENDGDNVWNSLESELRVAADSREKDSIKEPLLPKIATIASSSESLGIESKGNPSTGAEVASPLASSDLSQQEQPAGGEPAREGVEHSSATGNGESGNTTAITVEDDDAVVPALVARTCWVPVPRGEVLLNLVVHGRLPACDRTCMVDDDDEDGGDNSRESLQLEDNGADGGLPPAEAATAAAAAAEAAAAEAELLGSMGVDGDDDGLSLPSSSSSERTARLQLVPLDEYKRSVERHVLLQIEKNETMGAADDGEGGGSQGVVAGAGKGAGAAAIMRDTPMPRVSADGVEYNYAASVHGAKVVAANKEARGASAILEEDDKDKYLRNPCSADKWLVVELSEEVRVDTVVILNSEFYSSNPKDVEVMGSQRFPIDEAEWMPLGSFEAPNSRTPHFFVIPPALRVWVRYIKLRLLSHHGSEVFCTLSLLRVHGTGALESFKEEMEAIAKEVEEVGHALRTSPPVVGTTAAASVTRSGLTPPAPSPTDGGRGATTSPSSLSASSSSSSPMKADSREKEEEAACVDGVRLQQQQPTGGGGTVAGAGGMIAGGARSMMMSMATWGGEEEIAAAGAADPAATAAAAAAAGPCSSSSSSSSPAASVDKGDQGEATPTASNNSSSGSSSTGQADNTARMTSAVSADGEGAGGGGGEEGEEALAAAAAAAAVAASQTKRSQESSSCVGEGMEGATAAAAPAAQQPPHTSQGPTTTTTTAADVHAAAAAAVGIAGGNGPSLSSSSSSPPTLSSSLPPHAPATVAAPGAGAGGGGAGALSGSLLPATAPQQQHHPRESGLVSAARGAGAGGGGRGGGGGGGGGGVAGVIHSRPSNSHGHGHGNSGDFIFKALMQKIKALELNQSIFDHYLDDLNQKYVEMFGVIDQDIAALERRLRNMTLLMHAVKARGIERDARAKSEVMALRVDVGQKMDALNQELSSIRLQSARMEKREAVAVAVAVISLLLSLMVYCLGQMSVLLVNACTSSHSSANVHGKEGKHFWNRKGCIDGAAVVVLFIGTLCITFVLML